jgi:glyoxylase-like metal-dependent hydrolase (beta-lactamase superfamily II)
MGAGRSEGFVEVADRCFVARYAAWDVSVGLVVGSSGACVIDTRATARQGRELVDDARRLVPESSVRWVVNTHVHFDHTFGNVSMGDARVYAHENAALRLAEHAADIKRQVVADPELDPAMPEITREVLDDLLATQLREPDATFSSVRTVDLGDRLLELIHPGRGHTDSDVVVRVADGDVVFAGDLIEESGPPAFGPDSFPLDWAGTLDLVVGLLTERTVVVPGHGARVDKGFVQAQRTDLAEVSNLVRALHSQGVGVDEAVATGDDWPFPAATVEAAVRRGYAQLTGGGPGTQPGDRREPAAPGG